MDEVAAGVVKRLMRAGTLARGDRVVFISEENIKGIGLTDRLTVIAVS